MTHLSCLLSLGSMGPLCGSCSSGYVFSTSRRTCVACADFWGETAKTTGAIAVICAVLLGIHSGKIKIPSTIVQHPIIAPFLLADSGAWRVLMSNFQIIHSVQWTLDVTFPSIFTTWLSSLSSLSFGFVSLECFEEATYFTSVHLWGLVPIAFAVANFLVFFARMAFMRDDAGSSILGGIRNNARLAIKRQHTFAFLLMSYVVVPPVTRVLFQTLDCVTIGSSGTYLRADTAVNCASAEYQAFIVVDMCYILVYLAVPALWATVLWSNLGDLNPAPNDEKQSLYLRRTNQHLSSFKFLWEAYRVHAPFTEVVSNSSSFAQRHINFYNSLSLPQPPCQAETYRRIILVSVTPLISAHSSRRAAFGVLGALVSAILYREQEPFSVPQNNVLVNVAQVIALIDSDC